MEDFDDRALGAPAPGRGEPAYEIVAPNVPRRPLVLASPHSGRRYPARFLRQTRLGRAALRRSEDAYVDELFAAAPAHGAALIKALFPRTYVDPNREPLELDPGMFSDPLPRWANARSPRARAGLGTIARLGANGAPIYGAPLTFAEARQRLLSCYFPYHKALRRLVEETRARFGYALLLDCHSMPSQAVARPSLIGGLKRGGGRTADFVLGDCHGAACMPEVIARAEEVLRGLGYTVVRNRPYAGGFTTRRYGRPELGLHALQIEVNRALYMDEARLRRDQGMAPLVRDLAHLVDAVGKVAPFSRAAE